MALPSTQGKPGSLALRALSAAVMLPVAGVAIWLGGWVFAVLAAVAAALMYWEWQGLCGEKGGTAQGFAVLCGLGTLLSAWTGPGISIAAGVSAYFLVSLPYRRHSVFQAAGFVYILLACISLIWLRSIADTGAATIVWLLAVVVVTDTAAYFTGRTLGGPKLAPKISPKKTWSGLLGGVAGAAVAGGLVAATVDGANIVAMAVLGGGFAVVAQLGDLLVSKAKRAFDVKDSSNLIPGHGGVLDRFDGFLSTSLAMAALAVLGGGSPLIWL